jgi:hypothetical protein
MMPVGPTRFRSIGAAVIAASFLATLLTAQGPTQAQEPIKIGYSMAMTGGLGPNGQSALLARRSGRRKPMRRAGCSAGRSS